MATRQTFDQFRRQLGAQPAAGAQNRLMMVAGEQPTPQQPQAAIFPAFVQQFQRGEPQDNTGFQQVDALTPQERQAFQARMAEGNLFQRTLGTLDRRIQESQGLLALAPLGLFGGAGVPLQAASFFQGAMTNQPVGMSGLGQIGRALRDRMAPRNRIDPNTLTATNITPPQAAALAAAQRAQVGSTQGERNTTPREVNRANFESRARDLADRSARGGGLPY